jgi:uncharacterized membrane protein YccC
LLGVPDWLAGVVPDWLAEVARPKKVPPPWGTMARAVLALWVPMAVGFATGRKELGLLPAMGGLLSVMIDNGGPYWSRVARISSAAVLGGAPGLLIGTLIHGRGWVAVGAVTFVAGVSSIMARFGGTGSVTGLQLFVYSSLGLGPLGALRPWWHTALGFLAGVMWALLLITPGYLLSPRAAERKAVAEVYYALARGLRLLGTPGVAGARTALAAALNAAYDAMLTKRAYAGGRSRRDRHLIAVLNVSHQFAEAAAALRATGERCRRSSPTRSNGSATRYSTSAGQGPACSASAGGGSAAPTAAGPRCRPYRRSGRRRPARSRCARPWCRWPGCCQGTGRRTQSRHRPPGAMPAACAPGCGPGCGTRPSCSSAGGSPGSSPSG